ncbi:MAG: chromosome segregation protein SMC [Armatimonadetes bacterium]|nr:chromosome segregation protein SMC [Armatimonadota bacterium]
MRLKSLSLFGFKSFANKTELIFAPGITAVVGPNGSGKSNILDAIIWVLGERSTKALRSPKAADLLFAGNGRVKPASIAEVSLTLELDEPLEGGDGSQSPIARPYEFLSEIVITRRLKRTGESQFAINRVPCRLRDVQDLLLELGLSADSYAFVGQAEIDRLVFLSPQERRELIEQVAGVHRFQLRREDALANLERTEKNLTRIRDLVAELLRQRDALSGEVEKARKYEQLLKRQRELNIALLGWEHQVRLRRVERLKEELEALKRAVAETDEQIAAANAERSEVESALSKMEEGFQQLQTSAAQALEEAKGLENELTLCQERQKHLTQRRTQIAQQKAYIAERSKRLNFELSEAQKQLDALQHQKSLFEEQEAQMQEALTKAQEAVAELEQTVRQARDEHFEIERSLAESRSQIASYEPLAQSLRSRQAEVEREKSSVRELLSQLQHEWEKLVSQHQAVATDELDKIIRQLQQQIAEKRERAFGLRQQSVQVREQLAAMKARLAALEEMELSMAGIPQGARAVLTAVREGRLQGEFHLLAQLIRVPEGLEIAYESALGAAANYLVAPTFAEVQAAIEFLKATNSGRATFIALDFLAELGYGEERELAQVEAEGVIGWASELVQVTDERFVAAVRHVLRNTLLIEDLETARRLAPKLKGVRFVTRSGEVVAPTGTISGGATVQGAGSLFLRHREREELSSRVRVLETQAHDLETQLKTLESEIEALQNELASTMQKREEQRRVSERLSEEARRIAAERERRQKELERLDAEAIRLQREIESLQSEMETLRQRIAQLEREREDAQRNLAEAQAKLAEAIRQREAANQQWQQFRLVAAQWQTQFENSQRRVSELKEALDELRQQEEALNEEEGAIESELRELAERLPKIERQLEESRRRREQLEAALSNWHEERKKLIQRREEIEGKLANLSAQRNAQTEEVHRCEVRLTQAEAERSEIERRLVEEYQVAVEDAHAAAQRLEQKQIALDELERIKQEMAALGEVRLGVLDEYERLNERINFLQTQISDLEAARNELLGGLEALERQFRERFKEVLERVSETFNEMVQRFWQGGEGRLILTEGQTLAESGVEVKVKLPGKAEQDLLSLSGGEKAIVGLCFLFALLKINPAPFVLLDEVDAPLDDSNTDRFVSLLREFSDRTQFLVITHNPITVQAADHLYGVTMEEEGVSKVLSLSLKEALEWTEQP